MDGAYGWMDGIMHRGAWWSIALKCVFIIDSRSPWHRLS